MALYRLVEWHEAHLRRADPRVQRLGSRQGRLNVGDRLHRLQEYQRRRGQARPFRVYFGE